MTLNTLKQIIPRSIVIILVVGTICHAQNIVPNGDFESMGVLQCGWASFDTIFNTSIDNWNSPTRATPDIHSTLVPSNCWNYHPNSTSFCPIGSQMPHSGTSFSGFLNYNSFNANIREYLQVQLLEPMVPGTKYYVEFYVSLADSSAYATNNIGVGFSTTQTDSNTVNNLDYSPQLIFTDVITNKTDWVLLKDSLVPTQPYEYIIIGNFMNDTNTIIDTVPFISSDTSTSGRSCRMGISYYYCDDVSIVKGTCSLYLGRDTTLCEGETLLLNATTQNSSYLWQDGSTDSTYIVSEQGTYWVEVNGCEITFDTINIEFEDCDCFIYVPNSFTPNSDKLNDMFMPVYDCDFREYKLMIFNRWGENIFNSNNINEGWDGIHKGKPSPVGVYPWVLTYADNHGTQHQKTGKVTLTK